jgi:hypothetical protein
MKVTSESLNKTFDINVTSVVLEEDFNPKWDGTYRIDDSHLLREWEQNPENLKERGQAISAGKTGKKDKKRESEETRRKKSEASKKMWASGKMAKRKSQPRDPITGKFLNK